MGRGTTAALGVLIALLSPVGLAVPGLAAPGLAGVPDGIQLSGRLRAVDCAAGTLVLNSALGGQTVAVAPGALVRLNTFPVAVCALRPFAGSVAVVWLAPRGSRPVAVRVEVFSAASAVAPPAAYYPCCPFYPGFPGFPGIGIGIGFGVRPGYAVPLDPRGPSTP